MKKVLGIIGSPRRKGNTHLLVEKILAGVRDGGGDTEAFFLGDLEIAECIGCHACWQGRPCPHRDDMHAIIGKIIASDTIVFGTPVYWYGPTALMKGCIDRFVYFNGGENRAKIRGKSAVIAIPFEEEDLETVQPLEVFFEKCFHYLEMPLVGKIIAPGVTKRGEIKEKPEIMNQAWELGKKLAVPA
jgi:multimeric flavodoxin WrbA